MEEGNDKVEVMNQPWLALKEKVMSGLLLAWRWTNQKNYLPIPPMSYMVLNSWIQVCAWISSHNIPYLLSKTTSEKYRLLKWVRDTLDTNDDGDDDHQERPRRMITNFRDDWRDGTALCELIDFLHPDACPRHDLLHPRQENVNIELGLKLAKAHLGVTSDLTVKDFQVMDDETERKLLTYIAQLHSAFHQRCLKPSSNPSNGELIWSALDTQSPHRDVTCFAKGMGLVLAVKGQAARFNIYLQTNNCLDIVVEIVGPENEFCTKRITVRSPRKVTQHDHVDMQSMADSSSTTSTEIAVPAADDFHSVNLTSGRRVTIPFEYEMTSGKIAVGYVPQLTGRYKLSIIHQGQHITGSPYTINVDEPSSVNEPPKLSVVHLLASEVVELDHEGGDPVMPPIAIEADDNDKDRPTQPQGRVIRRKILRSIVYRNGIQVVLDGDECLPPDPRSWMSESAWDLPELASSEEKDIEDSTADEELNNSYVVMSTSPLADLMTDDQIQMFQCPSSDEDQEQEISDQSKSPACAEKSPSSAGSPSSMNNNYSNNINNNNNNSKNGRSLGVNVIQRVTATSCPTSHIFLNSNEYEDFWNDDNESIVRIRLKEWEMAALSKSQHKLPSKMAKSDQAAAAAAANGSLNRKKSRSQMDMADVDITIVPKNADSEPAK